MGQREHPPVLAEGLGKKYARGRALRDCALEVPAAGAGTLPGGQRTRVAPAPGKRPQLLMLDEPLADLDPLALWQRGESRLSRLALAHLRAEAA